MGNKVYDEQKPTLTATYAAKALNDQLKKFKNFLVEFGFVSRCNEASDEMITKDYMTATHRNFPNKPETPIYKFTREGFINIGSMFLDYRKNKVD